MQYDPLLHQHRSMRLEGYDYASPGAYFVTIVTHGRVCLLGEIRNDGMKLSQVGEFVDENWREIPEHFANVELGAFVVMPNHMHGIIILKDNPGRGVVSTPDGCTPGFSSTENKIVPDVSSIKGDETSPQQQLDDETSPLREMDGTTRSIQRPTLGQVLAYFKYLSTKQINLIRDSVGIPLWQRNYYDHIIRNEAEHKQIYAYIESNPLNWMDDEENPA